MRKKYRRSKNRQTELRSIKERKDKDKATERQKNKNQILNAKQKNQFTLVPQIAGHYFRDPVKRPTQLHNC